MNNVNQLINIILTTFIFYYLVNDIFDIDLFNIRKSETLKIQKKIKNKEENLEKQELEDMLNDIDEDLKVDEDFKVDKDLKVDDVLNTDYNNYIKSKDLNIGDLKKRKQIYEDQLNECEHTSTDLIDKNIGIATIATDVKSYTNGVSNIESYDDLPNYSELK